MAKRLKKAKEQTEHQGGPEDAIAIQVVFIDCDLFVIQFMMAICGKHHKQAREQYKANKRKAIQIIIVCCDSFVIQSTMKVCGERSKKKAENQQKINSIKEARMSHSGCDLRL